MAQNVHYIPILVGLGPSKTVVRNPKTLQAFKVDVPLSDYNKKKLVLFDADTFITILIGEMT